MNGAYFSATALQCVQACGQLSSTGCAQRMAEGDCAAIDVDFLDVKVQLADTVDVHRGKSLVDLSRR